MKIKAIVQEPVKDGSQPCEGCVFMGKHDRHEKLCLFATTIDSDHFRNGGILDCDTHNCIHVIKEIEVKE